MTLLFYIAGAVAVLASLLVITRSHAVHALLYMIVSLLAVSLVFVSLGAPFLAALEVIVYAGAIMVLFIFVIMMLNVGPQSSAQESQWLEPGAWTGPALLSALLLGLLIFVLSTHGVPGLEGVVVSPADVGRAAFGPYLIAVELAAILLLAGLVGAYHIGRKEDA